MHRHDLTLLAALTAGTVVVEASWRSLAVEVARHAVASGRVGTVVPGPVTSALSTRCHDLLRSDPRVRPVTGVADVIADLGRYPVAGRSSDGGRSDDRLA